ncbi:MAG: porin family protein [Ignavibacteriaceae bacterium]|jgi:hypothetical protein
MLKNGNSLVLVALFIIFTSSYLFAQAGIKGGLSVSALQSSKEDYRPFLGYEVGWVQHGTSNPVFGLQLGMFYTLKLSDKFNFQPEFYYSQRGYQFDQTPLYNTNYNLHINYLELPVLFEYKLPFDWSFKPGIIAGPFAALQISNDKQIQIADEEITGTVSSVNSIDYGLVFALGAEFNAWDGQIVLDLRINWGFSNVMSQPDEFISLSDNPGTVKTRAVIFMTGYRFNWNW